MLVTRMMGGDPAPWHEPLMVREMTQPTPTCRQFVQEFVRPMATVLLGILGELAPNASLADRYLIGFSIVGQCFYHKVNRPVITLLVGEEEYSKYSLDRLAEHITHFSLAALGHAPPLNAEGGGA
jgi:hypothetical protein